MKIFSTGVRIRAAEINFETTESNLMKQPLANDDDEFDDSIFDDPIQEESETAAEGNGLVRKKYKATIDKITAVPESLDSDLLEPPPVSEQDNVEVRRGKNAEDDEERKPLPPAVAPAIVKQRNKEKLAAAFADFGKLPALPKEATNDNFRQTVSWPLMDQLTRSTFEPDKERRTKLIKTARYIRELIDTGGADSLGSSVHLLGNKTSVDYAFQRTGSGNAVFEHGQMLDRKRVTYDNKDGETDAERYSGPVRTAKKSGPVSNSGFDPYRDEPFALRAITAREELNVIIAFVGPLWPSLVAAISENATLTQIGQSLGSKSGVQASGVGTVIIRLALEAAMEALEQFNGVTDAPRLTTPMPDKSRGSFRNQARGPVRSGCLPD